MTVRLSEFLENPLPLSALLDQNDRKTELLYLEVLRAKFMMYFGYLVDHDYVRRIVSASMQQSEYLNGEYFQVLQDITNSVSKMNASHLREWLERADSTLKD